MTDEDKDLRRGECPIAKLHPDHGSAQRPQGPDARLPRVVITNDDDALALTISLVPPPATILPFKKP